MEHRSVTGFFYVVSSCFWLNSAHAGSVGVEVTETMMQAQSYESVFVSLLFGIDTATTLNYSSDIDVTTRSFDYTSIAGQIYMGLPYALSSTGIYDAGSELYNWSSSGSLGSDSWTVSGNIGWVGDPVGHGGAEVVLGGKTYTIVIETLDYSTFPVFNYSTTSYSITGPAPGTGVITTWKAKGTDRLYHNGQWAHNVLVPKHPLVPDGVIRFLQLGNAPLPGGGPGAFQAQMIIAPVPLPGAFVMFIGALGFLRLIGRRRGLTMA